MKEKADWMKNLAAKNLTTTGGTLVVPIAESITGMTLSQLFYKVGPVVVPLVVVAGGAGYVASKYNQSNVEKQTPIQQRINELTQKQSDIESKLGHSRNKNTRYKCKKNLIKIKSELDRAKQQHKALESSSVTKLAAGVYDAMSINISKSVQNIYGAYKKQGAFSALQETAKYADLLPGIGGYPKAAITIMSGNFTHGLTEAAVHSYTGGAVSLPHKVVDVMAKTNAKELMSGLVVPAMMKGAEEQNTSAYNP